MMKIHVCPFQIGKTVIDTILFMEFASFREDVEHNEFVFGEKIVIIVFFVPMACRGLGMASLGDHAALRSRAAAQGVKHPYRISRRF
jgi:hypothetical protein